MKSKPIKIAATLAVLALAFAGLMYTSLSEEAQYYKHVEEVMDNPAAWHGKSLQLHGFVVDKSVLKKPDSLDWQFQVESKGVVVQASYTGIVPDTFKGGSEVVITGKLGPDGFAVDPNGVMAKCPSKYEPGKAGTPGS